MAQSSLHPHRLTPQRMAQIQKWRTLGAQARRGKHVAARSEFHRKRAKRGTSVTGSYAKSTAWGLQKMVVPVGLGGPILAMAKNRLPGYNQFQIVKATAHKSAKKDSTSQARKAGQSVRKRK